MPQDHEIQLTPESPTHAIEIQKRMRRLLNIEDDFGDIALIAGIDVGYERKNDLAKAAVVTMAPGKLEVFESVESFAPATFPYIPGLLSFREAPVAMQALAGLKTAPDMLFVDGQGIAHPRRLGIAAHIGILTGLPAVGIAKTRLCGDYEEPASEKGAFTWLTDNGERIGTVLRSRTNVKPLFISPGNRISHDTAVEWVIECLTRYRLPEPIRMADKLSKVSKRRNRSVNPVIAPDLLGR